MTTITALPTPPSRDDSANFPARADDFMAALPTFATEANLVAAEVNALSDLSASSAATASAAANSVGAAVWVSGTTYSIGNVRTSPVNAFPYIRLTAGAGTTDPSADPTNWRLAAVMAPALYIVTGTTQTAVSWGHYSLENAAASTLTLPAAPGVGDMVWVTVANDRTDNVIARNGLLIMGLAENMTLNDRYAHVALRYFGASKGWRKTS
jgi:hypothetical protein